MGRPPYGSVGGRRAGSAAWQWVIIGGVLGMGCSAILVLSLLTFGVLNIEGLATEVAAIPTVTAQPTTDVQSTVNAVVNATLSAIPSPTTQAAPQQAPQGGVIVAPTPTPFVTPTTEPTQETIPSQTAQQTDSALVLLPSGGIGASGVPERLRLIATQLERVDGGTFSMGTSAQEVATAVRECVDRDGARCEESMGLDSFPPHDVTLNPFYIEQTEVTNAQYVEFLNVMGPNSHQDCDGFRCVDTRATNEFSVITFDSQNYDVAAVFANLPIVGVTWYGAKAYCEALGRRLPTEAEWEYAARGTDGRRYPWGEDWDVTFARTNRPDPNNVGAVEVRSYLANVSPFGVYDMAGNVAEWVADWYSANYYAQPAATGLDPTGPLSGVEKVVRGGSWDQPPFFARTVHRLSVRPDESRLWLGFRCAADFDESEVLPNTQPASPLGTLPATSAVEDTQAPTPELNAAPTLPPLPTSSGSATDIPAVPPGG